MAKSNRLTPEQWADMDPGDAAKLLPNVSCSARDLRAYRDDLIRRMRADGASFRAIATAAGLSVHAIELIVHAKSMDATATP